VTSGLGTTPQGAVEEYASSALGTSGDKSPSVTITGSETGLYNNDVQGIAVEVAVATKRP
jgi:hypothetical protein